MIKNYFLFVLALLSFKNIAQSNYAVTPIPFTQYTGSLPVQGTFDDKYSNAIDLPFSFDFYGTSYTQIVVSTNGYIDFRVNLANGSSPFAFSQAIPNAAFPVKNSILGAFQDLNNSNGQGTITYGTFGTAPYRKFIVVFNNQSLFPCPTYKSSFQMILCETSNIVDVQLIDKQTCPAAGSSKTVTGLIDLSGSQGIAAPGRNTGSWTAFHEGWRFSRPGYYSNYPYTICGNGGVGMFNLQVAQNELSPSNPSAIAFYESLTDATSGSNSLPLNYYNLIPGSQTIFAVGNGTIKQVVLNVIPCSTDYDNDGVATNIEDVNADTNLANDDSDNDGIPNYLDNDDDGDLILTNLEYVFTGKNTQNVLVLLDTDNDGTPNYLDNDDDGDGVLTYLEDYNADGNPANDDTNLNGIPDYLEFAVALGVQNNILDDTTIAIYPNPVNEVLKIQNNSNITITNVSIYSISGSLIKEVKSATSIESISVSDLQSGVYFVKLQVNGENRNYKFVKK